MIQQKKDFQSKPKKYSRRKFIGSTAAAAAALSAIPLSAAKRTVQPKTTSSSFKLKYAPSLGMFKEHAGKDPIDQLKFMADQGFRAMFDNGLMNRTPQVQEAIAREMERLNMTLCGLRGL